jgi:hypothetical protein
VKTASIMSAALLVAGSFACSGGTGDGSSAAAGGAGGASGAGASGQDASGGGGQSNAGASGANGGAGGSTGAGGTGAAGAGGSMQSSGHGGAGGEATPLDAGTPPDAHVSIDDAGVMRGAARPIAAPPTYRGSVDNGAECSKRYMTHGFEPVVAAGTRHPLFLHFTGTNFFADEASFRAQVAPGADAVTRAMAERGFVALRVEYDNSGATWSSDHAGLFACLFGAANPENIIAVACALPQVDCALGIATWGHSLGGFVAHAATRYEPRIRAAWLTGCCGNVDGTLPVDRLRIVNGEADTLNVAVPTMNAHLGFTLEQCPDDGRNECLRADGSGWIIVRRADCVLSSADHCWFDKANCLDALPMLEPSWIDPASPHAFALAKNADWVVQTVMRP